MQRCKEERREKTEVRKVEEGGRRKKREVRFPSKFPFLFSFLFLFLFLFFPLRLCAFAPLR